jgi:hypothetical protein
MSDEAEDYDGLYFVPYVEDDEEIGLDISYFRFNTKKLHDAPAIENTNYGDKYHIAFFKRDDEGNAAFDASFEAILVDPDYYIRSLAGAGVYGCVVRKTANSSKWFDDYLTRTKKHVMLNKFVKVSKKIVESKRS